MKSAPSLVIWIMTVIGVMLIVLACSTYGRAKQIKSNQSIRKELNMLNEKLDDRLEEAFAGITPLEKEEVELDLDELYEEMEKLYEDERYEEAGAIEEFLIENDYFWQKHEKELKAKN